MRVSIVVPILFVTGCYGSAQMPDASGHDAASGSDTTPSADTRVDALSVPDAHPALDGSLGSDAGPTVDAHDPSVCRAMDAELSHCASGSVGGAFFDGERCVAHLGGCRGADCFAFSSLADCQRATAFCSPSLCVSTRGTWRTSSCGHYTCGAPPMCAALIPGCDCGRGRSYREGVGCFDDPACGVVALCAATSGRWVEPGPSECLEQCHCGRIMCDRSCRPVTEAHCACGMYREFDLAEGCRTRSECTQTDWENLCRSTGGSWGQTCANSSCGMPSTAECLSFACTCPAEFTYREGFGCIRGGCTGACERTCAAPNLCCPMGVAGQLTCVTPICTSTNEDACPASA